MNRAGVAVGIAFDLVLVVAIYLMLKTWPISAPPSPAPPSCQLGVALEAVDGLRWRETVVVCKGPQGEPVILRSQFFVRVDRGWR